MHGVLSEEVAHGEVVELQRYASYDTCLSPTEGELHLVVGFLLKRPVDVNRSVLVVWLYVGVHLLRVEESH